MAEVKLMKGNEVLAEAAIRCGCDAYYGYPILGDGKYGNNEANKKFKMKKQELTSYSLKFNFTSPSGILEYLSGMEIHL